MKADSCDVIVIGGSYAGLSAALQLARARRRVLVIDAGRRRNRFASSSHGFLGQDGRDPVAIAADARAQLLAYPTVTWIDGTVATATAADGGFAVTLASGATHHGRRLVLATGVVDELPDVPGLAEQWGRNVFHCPYCHGYELDGGPVGVLAVGAVSMHQAVLLPDWGPTTLLSLGRFDPDAEQRAELARREVAIEPELVVAIEPAEAGHGATVRLRDGRRRSFAGLFVAPRIRPSPLAAELGCELEDSPLGPIVKADPMRATTVPGVFAAGDVAIATASVAIAVADGARAGVAAHRSLIVG
ncbi:MAG TPA: NAD(P)/FAD-dependent oxidoreductase [Kofleriaceae bacterium]|nr:NAD(P)/FAD-dependent oxidoreductase [Kofleriaceae bacterium]